MNSSPYTDPAGYPTRAYLAAIGAALIADGLAYDDSHSDVDGGELWFSVRLDDGGRLMLQWRADRNGLHTNPTDPEAVACWSTFWFDEDGDCTQAPGFYAGTSRAYTTKALLAQPDEIAGLVRQILRDKIAEAA